MRQEEANKLAIKALKDLSEIGQKDITKHDVLLMIQTLEPTIKDGYVIGKAIFNLSVEGYLHLTGKKGMPTCTKDLNSILKQSGLFPNKQISFLSIKNY